MAAFWKRLAETAGLNLKRNALHMKAVSFPNTVQWAWLDWGLEMSEQLLVRLTIYIYICFYMNSLSIFFFASFFFSYYLSSYIWRRLSVEIAWVSLFLVFRRIGGYISLDPFSSYLLPNFGAFITMPLRRQLSDVDSGQALALLNDGVKVQEAENNYTKVGMKKRRRLFSFRKGRLDCRT